MTFSSSQIYFFICAALLIGLLLVCLWVGMKGLFQGRKEFETQELNSYVYSDELAELERDLNRGSITRAQLDEGKEELE
ncbi:c-type cytochrome biogenesis protein CcmI, partial [Turicimonas muris]|uniref:c-type cytochrome biogenesis protein CcmI n=1 Tax=Turicimonas muris TaxID=1796652 RepID=UPI0034A07AE8